LHIALNYASSRFFEEEINYATAKTMAACRNTEEPQPNP
jgi:hypothetical protein